MPTTSCLAESTDYLLALRRLALSRWLVYGLLALSVLIIPPLLDIPLPQRPLLGTIGLASLLNALLSRRLRRASSASPLELFSQLLLDMASLSALVFFTGGATNPLVSLLLPPVAIAALTLPARCVAGIAALAIAAYSLLMVFYLPLPIGDASRATRLHLGGMWLIFTLSTALIGTLIVRMMQALRQRDTALAAAREQALRDERVMAMGTLAAGAAHELGTPLATMALIAGELAVDPALPAALHADIALLRQQIGTCKEIITGLSRRAGAERLDEIPVLSIDRWLDAVRQRWQALQPLAESSLHLLTPGEPPRIAGDPRLEQALLNLLNNAFRASQKPVSIEVEWNERVLNIAIHDDGPGFPQQVLELGGRQGFPPHAGGSGIGLMLTRSAIEQLGGRIILSNPGRGARVCLKLPRNQA